MPVPDHLGNGQSTESNLYWGAMYGVKSQFKRSGDWQFVKKISGVQYPILERLLFKHATSDTYIMADAYDGRDIKRCTIDFLDACSGNGMVEIVHEDNSLRFGGCSQLVAYAGHDGLMEFSLDETFEAKDSKKRQAMILACVSKEYFAPYLKQTGAEPLVWTTQLMAPEAYTLEWAMTKWAEGGSDAEVYHRAAEAYSHYQKCSLSASMRLLISGY